MILPAQLLADRVAFHARRLRLARRWTLAVASDRAGLPLRHWQKIEAATNNLELITLETIAETLSVDAVELFVPIPANAPLSPPRRAGRPTLGREEVIMKEYDMSHENALVDMPPDDGAGYVPPLLMAAAKAGVELRMVIPLFYAAGKLTDPGMVTVGVRREGYTVRRKCGARWRTLCQGAKRVDTAMRHVLAHASRYCACGGFFQEGAFVHTDRCAR